MLERLRTDKRRLLQEVAIIAVAYFALQYVTDLIFGPADGSSISGWLRTAMSVVIFFGLSLLIFGGTHALFAARRTVESMEIRAGDPQGWPPASFAVRDRFAQMGFEQFGSIDVRLPDHTATFAGVLSPDGTTMAIVTPVHITMMTDFSGKILNTTNHAAGAPTRYELRQGKRHATPEELWELHRQGLAVVAESGMTPTVYNAMSAMTAFVAIEEYSKTQFIVSDQAKGLVGGGSKPLALDRRASSRIATWRDSPYRWEAKVS